MRPPVLFRLVLASAAASLLLASLAYDWLGNVAHEIIGTGLFLLLISHNIFNRRWYGALSNGSRDPRNIVSRTITLSLLVTMLSLLVTSVIISQSVFSFLPVTSTFSMRQIHAMIAYLALLIAGAHLGLHWSRIMDLACSRLGITAMSNLYTSLVRVAALVIAAAGVQSLFVINVGPKLSMKVIFEFWDFERKTLAFFLRHMVIIGLCAFLSHYGLKLISKA